jgi:hypothetical protein
MTSRLETKIGTIHDKDFRILVSKLCLSVDLDEDGTENMSLINLFNIFVKEKKVMNRRLNAFDGILAVKIKDLALDSVVHCVCLELVTRKEANMDDFAGKTVFTLVKQCYNAVCPALQRPKEPTRRELAIKLKADLIKRGRASGSYH